MPKIDTVLSDSLFARPQKIAEILDLEFEEVLHLYLVYGGY